jgi:NADPH:quinone reductase-like Zn-dependent oxidoreductase
MPAPAASAPTRSSWPSTSGRPSPPPREPATSNGFAPSAPTPSSTTGPRTSKTSSIDYDVVLDSQSGDTLAKSLRVLKPAGIAIGIAGPPDPDFARQLGRRFPLQPVMALLSFKTRRAARRRGVRYSFLFMRASGAQLNEITKLIDAGVLRPIVERTYPFDEAPQALAHVEGGRSKGKVVITMI